MLNWGVNSLLSKQNIMEVFFNKIAGKQNVKMGNVIYIMPVNYETDKKRVIADKRIPPINLKNNNMEPFMDALTEYVRTFFESEAFWANPIHCCYNNDDKLVYALSNLWLNATFEDFENPIPFIKRYTNFLKDKTFDGLQSGLRLKNMQTLKNCDIEIKQIEQDEFQETPKAIMLTVKKNGTEKKLPRIAYGISEGIAYIYGIQGYKTDKKQNKELKDVNRARYQVNVVDRIPVDYRDLYVNKQKQEPYAYISLFAFLCLLKQKGINEVQMPVYLSEREAAKEISIRKDAKTIFQRFKGNNYSQKAKRKELGPLVFKMKNHKRIQYNIINKFLSYMTRMECDVPGINIIETPDENNSGLVVDISNMSVTPEENIIFYELYRKIEESTKQKKKEGDIR